MSEPICNRVEYDLSHLIKDIKLGKIGLPDIQRPFLWPNVKVRDLFDSLYRGYPIGYLLLWERRSAEEHKQIGVDEKQVAPNLVVVDGQQRLTSLYAVFLGAEVVRADYAQERIHIAFNPLEQEFEVASAATRQDRAFIPDISVVLSDEPGLIPTSNQYVKALSETRDLSPAEVKRIQDSLQRLNALSSFRLTALHLSADVPKEEVAEVFVRINSQGKSLNQADFILTLTSVFWDEGRTLLEDFCRQARIPKGAPSAYNPFIDPSPNQLLRATVGLAFRRARLSSIYSMLRGKNLETGELSVELRERQFALLKDAQERALDLDNWHGFLRCVQHAGFRTRRMVISDTALIYSYVLYLIGRTEVKVGEREMRTAIAQWFFMASLTRRYAGSGESAMESDLASLRGVHTPKEFLDALSNAMRVVLTNDFWEVTLPNELATSASRSPSLFAFQAALVLLDAPVLFSNTKLREWLDPAVKQPNSLERHHLFPKDDLARQGFPEMQINQIANYAYVEWQDNRSISNHAPSEYAPAAASPFTDEQVKDMYRLNAMPVGWERMAYDEFLKERRTLMARLIRDGYKQLALGLATNEPAALDLVAVLAAGEGDRVEFKSTLRTNLHTGKKDPRIEDAIVKTIAGFLNAKGGTLVIGAADDGSPVGIEKDGFDYEDKMSLHLTNLVNDRIGAKAWTTIHANFDDHDDVRVLVVRCERAPEPAYAKVANEERFFVRTGSATIALSVADSVEYIKQRFG